MKAKEFLLSALVLMQAGCNAFEDTKDYLRCMNVSDAYIRNHDTPAPSIIFAALDLENKTIQSTEIYTSVKDIKSFKLPIRSISETDITFKECFKWYDASTCTDGNLRFLYTIRRETLELEKDINLGHRGSIEHSFECKLIEHATYKDNMQAWEKVVNTFQLAAEKERQAKDKRLWEKQGDNQI
ncbi:hypothetical protein N9P41_02205 [Pseudomonadales bacterium]|nr:hypothetical protein [Pseudomonadales bacterium]